MPSVRKQRAREKRSRQSDVMSDLENVDLMLERTDVRIEGRMKVM